MALAFYNTLTNSKEAFKPITSGKVLMYNCGPTTYNYAHIGNFRAYICSDILRRYLEYSGYKVTQVMNITDIDDKTISGSQKEGMPLKEFTEKYNKAFFEDIVALNIKKAAIYPKATEHIQDMVGIIKKLRDKGYTYETAGSTYYDVSKCKDYGKLSGIKAAGLKAGASARVDTDEYAKESAQDFALWKAWSEDDGEVFFETDLGRGRPGWHIECSAMSMKYLGETFDIHTGGVDLIFPHHENEIAQSEAATGKQFVKYWLHNEYMMVESRKMSKSLGNFYTLRDILGKGYKPKAVRYLLLSTHYRQPLNFTFEGLKAAGASVQRLLDLIQKLKDVGRSIKEGEKANKKVGKKVDKLLDAAKKEFEAEMDDDLNISAALGAIFRLVREINSLLDAGKLSETAAKKAYDQFMSFDKVLGVMKVEEEELEPELMDMIEKREEARKNKDYAAADKIRSELQKRGIVLEDTPKGVRWKRA